MKMLNLVIGGVLILVAIVVMSSVFTVREDQQVLVVQFGEVVSVEPDPGLHFKVPIIQNILEFDKRVLDFDAPAAEIPTLDQKQLVVTPMPGTGLSTRRSSIGASTTRSTPRASSTTSSARGCARYLATCRWPPC